MADETPNVRPEELLGTPLTEDYAPHAIPGMYLFHRQRPLFTPTSIAAMLTDPRIQFGLSLMIGPIMTMTSVVIECEDAEFVKFANQQYRRFWNTSVARVLSSIPWGYSGSEVMYKEEDGQLSFDVVRDLKAWDVRAVSFKGELVGMTVKGMVNAKLSPDRKLFIGGPKCLWNVHSRGHHLFYGQSHMYGCYVPWWETWSEGGYRDMRRLWFYKNCFRSPIIRHPPGSSVLTNGVKISNKDLAREIVEKIRSGAVLAMSSLKDSSNNYLWEYEEAQSFAAPEGLMDYGDMLRLEVFEGMGIPSEVVEQEGNGLGTGEGRSIPLLSFLASLQTIAQWVVFDFDNQILRNLARMNFSDGLRYQVYVKPLIDTIINDENEPLTQEGEPGEEVDEEGNPLEEEIPDDNEPAPTNKPPTKQNGKKPGKLNGKPKVKQPT